MEECSRRCEDCERCNYISYSLHFQDCSIYHTCQMDALHSSPQNRTTGVPAFRSLMVRAVAPEQESLQDEATAKNAARAGGKATDLKLLPRMAWRQRSGVWLLPIIPYKTGSTQWLKLLLFDNIGLRVDPHRPRNWLLRLHDHDVPHQMPDEDNLMMTKLLVRLVIVRNPYERMLSVYLDKLRDRKRELQMLPRSLTENSTFADFVHAVVSETPGRPRSVIGAEHYGPITTWWKLPCAPADACWLGFHNATRILKLELMDDWFADVVGTLGWEASTSDAGWDGGCFYRPVGTDCGTALLLPPANATTSAPSAGRGGGGGGCGRGGHGGHAHGGCEAMAAHYTPELAARVTAFARGDLVRFGYPEWHGNVSEPWY